MKNKNPLTTEIAEQRVFFKDNYTREKFFLKLKQKYGSWTLVGKNFTIYKSRLENLRNGSISIPYYLFQELCNNLNEKDREYYQNNILLKNKHWGRSKGGKITYSRHKEIFEKGRENALKKTSSQIPINIDSELCEFIGAFIGEGFMNKYGSTYLIQITGDYNLDKNYYEKVLTRIIKNILPKSKPYMVRVDNVLRFTVYSKDMYIFFTERLHMKKGKKVYSVTIPEEILNSENYDWINSCIRGIYDTDGCVAFDKRKSHTTPYIRIVLHMKSPELIKQIHYLLLKQNIKSTITKNNDYVQINGRDECKKFISKIGFSNSRHLNKIKNLN